MSACSNYITKSLVIRKVTEFISTALEVIHDLVWLSHEERRCGESNLLNARKYSNFVFRTAVFWVNPDTPTIVTSYIIKVPVLYLNEYKKPTSVEATMTCWYFNSSKCTGNRLPQSSLFNACYIWVIHVICNTL